MSIAIYAPAVDPVERTLAYVALTIAGALLAAGVVFNPHFAAWSVLPGVVGLYLLGRP